MLDTQLRTFYDTVCLSPVLKLPWMQRVSPSLLTFFGVCVGCAGATCIGFGWPCAAVGLLLLSGYFDTLDGAVARMQQRSSEAGAVFDITSDRVVEFAILLGVYCAHPEHGLLSFLMLGSVLLCVTSFLVVGIFSENKTEKSFHYSPGIMERTEAFALWILMVIMPEFFVPLALLFITLVFATACIRLIQFAKQS